MKSFTFLLVFLASMCLTIAQQAPVRKIVLKVNLGGGPVGDFLGEDQVLEVEGFHKATTKDAIQNTDQSEIFQTQRFARDEDFVMRIPVPDGIYSVTLLFAETYEKACTPGGRTFDISLGTPISGVIKIFDDFDIFQAAGCKAAHGKRFDKVPSKEGIVVHLGKKAQHPSLAGFVVEGLPVPKGDGSEYRAVGLVQPEGIADGGMNQGTYGASLMPGQAVGPSLGAAAGTSLEGQQSELIPPGGAPLNGAHPAENPLMGTGSMVHPPPANPAGFVETEQVTAGLQPGGVGAEATQAHSNLQVTAEQRVQDNGVGRSQVTVRPGGIMTPRSQSQPNGNVRMDA